MNPTPQNPTLSMSFIAGFLLLLSIFSLFNPEVKVSGNPPQATHPATENPMFSTY